METRASYILVGGFVIALAAGILAFALWIGAARKDENTVTYRVEFTGTVSGLQVGSSVFFRGIPVGSVTDLRIEDGGSVIAAIIDVREDTPIKVDTEAMIEQKLITGVSVVQLLGGSPDSPRLDPAPGEKLAVIRARQSTFEELTESAPELIANVTRLVDRASQLLSPQNIASIEGILSDMKVLSRTVAARSDDIGAVIDEGTATMVAVHGAVKEIQALASEIRVVAREQSAQLEPTVNQVQRTARVFSELATSLDGMIKENRRAFHDFSQTGLYELTRFLTEARSLVAALQRMTERMERDPARFLFGDSQRGVQVE